MRVLGCFSQSFCHTGLNMHRFIFLPALFLLALPLCAAEKYLDFSELKPGETPPGFRSTVGGEGKPGDWRIVLDDTPSMMPAITPGAPSTTKRPVLAQLSRDRTDEHFPLLIWDEETLEDFTLSARFKLVAGEEEQMAGIAFRIRDEKNYYYIRASALGNTFNFFKIVEGVRSAPIGVKADISKSVWHEMRVGCRGGEIRGWLDGNEMFPALRDQSFSEGKIGLWTKSDSVSYFCDIKLVYTPKIPFAQTLVSDALKKYPRLVGLKIFAACTKHPVPAIIASSDRQELGKLARAEELDVIGHSTIYYGKEGGNALVTMPLHDGNGETVAAVKVVMKSFPGQTEKNALARALPIIKQMESRVHSLKELTE